MDIAIASSRMRKVRRSGPVAVDTPTPERIVQSGGAYRIGHAVRAVDVERDGVMMPEEMRVPRVRMDEDPFDRLAARGQLDPDDDMNNDTLKAAGDRYRRLHRKAGLETLQGQDPSRGFTTAREAAGLLGTEIKCEYFALYSAAVDAVTPLLLPVLDQIVLFGTKPEEAGSSISRYTDKKICSGIALHNLRCALRELAAHFAREESRL